MLQASVCVLAMRMARSRCGILRLVLSFTIQQVILSLMHLSDSIGATVKNYFLLLSIAGNLQV